MFGKYKIMNPDFEQNHFLKTARSIYRIGHDAMRLIKCMAYFDR